MITLSILICTSAALAFGILLLIRNEIVYRYVRKRIEEVSEANEKSLDEGDFLTPTERWEEFERTTTYDKMLFELNKWTYSDFYEEKP